MHEELMHEELMPTIGSGTTIEVEPQKNVYRYSTTGIYTIESMMYSVVLIYTTGIYTIESMVE